MTRIIRTLLWVGLFVFLAERWGPEALASWRYRSDAPSRRAVVEAQIRATEGHPMLPRNPPRRPKS